MIADSGVTLEQGLYNHNHLLTHSLPPSFIPSFIHSYPFPPSFSLSPIPSFIPSFPPFPSSVIPSSHSLTVNGPVSGGAVGRFIKKKTKEKALG